VISKGRETGGSFIPEIIGYAELVTDAAATRAAGVLAGFAVGLGRGGELRDALAVLGLRDGIAPDKATRKAVTAGLDEEWRRLHSDAA